MAGSNKYSYYSNSALQTTTFSQDQPVNTDWFDEVTRTETYTQNNISVSGSTENIKYFFSVGNYEEKAVLNGLDYSRTTFRNNNEYKISKVITNQQGMWTIRRVIYLETMALQGQQDPLLTMWVTSCAIRLLMKNKKVSS
jgi:hypothetical protein